MRGNCSGAWERAGTGGENDERFEIKQLLFADDTTKEGDAEEKLCRLASEFGRECERRKLSVNIGKRKRNSYEVLEVCKCGSM